MRDEILLISIIFGLFVGFYFLNLLGADVLVDVLMGNKDDYVLGIGRGISMMPAIEPGNFVIIDTRPENIQIGDVIVYRYGDQLIGHRVIAITQDGYITKGDNNPYVDNLVPKEAVVGKIVWEVENPNILDIWILNQLFG